MTIDPKSNSTATATPQQTHAKASEHFDAASMAHKEAAKHIASGDTKQAGYHAAVAQGHALQANEHSEAALKNTANSASSVK